MLKQIYVDVETTGTDPKINGLIQLAFIIKINGEEKERKCFNIQPFKDDFINPEALYCNGLKAMEIEKFPRPERIYKAFCQILDKYVNKFDSKDKFLLHSYGGLFDYNFLRYWFEKNDDNFFGSYVYYPPMDVMNLAAYTLMYERNNLTFSLHSLADYLDIDTSKHKAHNALDDIDLTIKVENRLKEKIFDNVKTALGLDPGLDIIPF